MATQIITNNALPSPDLVLYVPRVTRGRVDSIADVLQRAGLGSVKRVDVNPLQNTVDAQGTAAYFEVFVHFDEWWPTPLAHAVQSAIQQSGSYKLTMGSDREFWMLTRARNPLSETERRLHDRITELEQLVDLMDIAHQEDLAKRDSVMEQLVARVALIDLPEDHAPGEATLEEARYVADLDPLLEIPESEHELPLAREEAKNREKAARLDSASDESSPVPCDTSNVTTRRGSRRRGKRGGARRNGTLTISTDGNGIKIDQN